MDKKFAVMQPYFLPYIGYWQLLNYVDKFVVYDNIEFSKRGWYHRNRVLVNGNDKLFTLPIEKDSDFLNVNQRFIADEKGVNRTKTFNLINENYRKAPYYQEFIPVLKSIFFHDNLNLFEFVYHSILEVKKYLGIETEIIVSSTLDIDHSLRKEDKLFALGDALGIKNYINPIGGMELYDKESFQKGGLNLSFLKSDVTYTQGKHDFVSNLSIVDVCMFNSREEIKVMLEENFNLL